MSSVETVTKDGTVFIVTRRGAWIVCLKPRGFTSTKEKGGVETWMSGALSWMEPEQAEASRKAMEELDTVLPKLTKTQLSDLYEAVTGHPAYGSPKKDELVVSCHNAIHARWFPEKVQPEGPSDAWKVWRSSKGAA